MYTHTLSQTHTHHTLVCHTLENLKNKEKGRLIMYDHTYSLCRSYSREARDTFDCL